jgi:hypothetical protein
MARRYMRRAITAGLLTCGLAATAPASGWAQEANVLLAPVGQITLVGCFAEQRVKRHNKYVLLSPSIGSATSVTEATCTSTGTGRIKLEKLHKAHLLDTSMLGRWVEVSGDLRKMGDGDADDIRDMHVTAIRAVPVVAPSTAEVLPAPAPPPAMEVQPAAPRAEAIAPAEAAPVGTTGVMEQPKEKHKARLPHTASSLPLIGLIGLFAIAGGFALGLVDRRRTLGRR